MRIIQSRIRDNRDNRRRTDFDDVQPGPSGYIPPHRRAEQEMTPEQRAEKLIKEAEAALARILEAPGKPWNFDSGRCENRCNENRVEQGLEGGENNAFPWSFNANYVHSSMADEDYMVLGGHVDELTRRRIYNCEYIDFSKLLARDRVASEDDHRLEMVQRDGHVYWVPATDKDGSNAISGFSRWEQAFRVFANIFCQKYPEKSAELIQYNHVIHTASLSYAWDNVYAYDKDFRIHIARHPYRSWSVILQQSWSIRLKDRIHRGDFGFGGNQCGSGSGDRRARKEICWRYNRGRCSYGNNCKFEHKCAICLKFGHGSHVCRRANDSPRRQSDNRGFGRDSRDNYHRDSHRESDYNREHRDDKKKDYGKKGNGKN